MKLHSHQKNALWIAGIAFGQTALLGYAPSGAAAEQQLDTVQVQGVRQVDAQQPPASTQKLTGKTLQQQGVYRLEDLQQIASGLEVTASDPFDTRLTIRGLGDGGGSEINIGMPSSVGLFLDNVYLSRPGMLSNDLLDIESAEVFSGPQGTLHGFNTTAGAIDIHSRKPTFTPEGSVSQSIGQRGYTQTQFMFSGALTDTLAGRVNLSHTEKGGFIKNEYTGHELGGSNQDGLRGQLLWRPSDDFNLRVIADLNQSTSYPVQVLDKLYTINGTQPYLDRATQVGAHVVGGGSKVNTDSENEAYVRQGACRPRPTGNWATATTCARSLPIAILATSPTAPTRWTSPCTQAAGRTCGTASGPRTCAWTHPKASTSTTRWAPPTGGKPRHPGARQLRPRGADHAVVWHRGQYRAVGQALGRSQRQRILVIRSRDMAR